MHKKTLNIISVCLVTLIIVFSITHKSKNDPFNSDNISVDEKGKVLTKADQYQANILETISEENIKNFKEFAKTFEKNSADNITDGLSKDIFSQYIKYNTSGDIKPEEIINATQNVLKNKTEVSGAISYSGIKTVPSTTENLRIYGNNLAVIQNSVNNGVASLNKKTNKTPYIASIFLRASILIQEIAVPESLADSHINVINGYKKYSEGLIMLDQQSSDPAKALLGLNKAKEATNEILLSFDKIKKTIILNKDKLNYTSSEPGYIFLINN